MSNPYYPGGPHQPRNPFQQNNPPPQAYQGGYPGPAQPYQSGQPYQPPQHYQPQAFGHYGSPPPQAYQTPPRAGRTGAHVALSLFTALALIGCAVVAGLAANAGREGGAYTEFRFKVVNAIVGLPFLDGNSEIDGVRTLTWIVAAVAGILAFLVAVAPGRAIGAISGIVGLGMAVYYAAALIKINDVLSESSVAESSDFLLWPGIALGLWALTALLGFATMAAGSSRRHPHRY